MSEHTPHSELAATVREALLQHTEGYFTQQEEALTALAELEEQLQTAERERDEWRDRAVRLAGTNG